MFRALGKNLYYPRVTVTHEMCSDYI
jgi:hypothetical protein